MRKPLILVLLLVSNIPAYAAEVNPMTTPTGTVTPQKPAESPASAPTTTAPQVPSGSINGGSALTPAAPVTPTNTTANTPTNTPAPANNGDTTGNNTDADPTSLSGINAAIEKQRKVVDNIEKDIQEMIQKGSGIASEIITTQVQLKNIESALEMIQTILNPQTTLTQKNMLISKIQTLVGRGYKFNVNDVPAMVRELQAMKAAREKEIKTLEAKLKANSTALIKLQDNKKKAEKKLEDLIAKKNMMIMAITMGQSL